MLDIESCVRQAEPLHPWGLGGFVSLAHCSTMSCHILEWGPTSYRLRWHSSNLCSTSNLVFGGQSPPKYYLTPLAHMDFCWKIPLRWGPQPRMFQYPLGQYGPISGPDHLENRPNYSRNGPIFFNPPIWPF